MAQSKIDLTLLKMLVSELETSLDGANGIQVEKKDLNGYIVELAKASGVAAGIMQEAHLLVKDIYTLVRLTQGPAPEEGSDILDQIFGMPKGKNAN